MPCWNTQAEVDTIDGLAMARAAGRAYRTLALACIAARPCMFLPGGYRTHVRARIDAS